jgi:hypothetical protein
MAAALGLIQSIEVDNTAGYDEGAESCCVLGNVSLATLRTLGVTGVEEFDHIGKPPRLLTDSELLVIARQALAQIAYESDRRSGPDYRVGAVRFERAVKAHQQIEEQLDIRPKGGSVG